MTSGHAARGNSGGIAGGWFTLSPLHTPTFTISSTTSSASTPQEPPDSVFPHPSILALPSPPLRENSPALVPFTHIPWFAK